MKNWKHIYLELKFFYLNKINECFFTKSHNFNKICTYFVYLYSFDKIFLV